MLSTYSFKRTTFLVGTMIFAGLAVAMMAQSVHAENMAGVGRAVVSNGSGSKVFSIDTSGRMTRGGAYSFLEITRLEPDGSLVGKYYASNTAAPSSTNVSGTIIIIGATNSAIRISFTALQAVGMLASTTVFEGAIRLGGARDPSFGFMAGTFTFTDPGAGQPQGPFPFCAMLASKLG
jgi:hypothetical protein